MTLKTIRTTVDKIAGMYTYQLRIVENGLETDKVVIIRATNPLYLEKDTWVEIDFPDD